MRYFALFIPLLLTACINEQSLSPVFPAYDLHGNSAKVWVLSESDDQNAVSTSQAYKNCFIFYSNLHFRDQSLIYLGSQEGKVGSYSVIEDKKYGFILTLHYTDMAETQTKFRVQTVESQQLVLQSIGTNETTYKFISLPSPNLN